MEERERDSRPVTNEQRNTATRPVNTEDTNGHEDSKIHNVNVCILTNDKHNIARSWLQPNRPANRCRCLFVNIQKRGRLEVLPKAHGHSSEQREPPETCTERSYGAMEEREAFGLQSDNTSSSLRAIPSLSPSPPFYSLKKGAVSLINYPPNKSNYLGSSLYLIPSYLHRRSRTREGPVRTLLCTGCAWGRFSSRHPPPPNRASTGMRQNLSWDGENRNLFDPLPCYRNRHSRTVEFRQVIHPVVVGASYHVRPEPPPCELPCCAVLFVEATVVD